MAQQKKGAACRANGKQPKTVQHFTNNKCNAPRGRGQGGTVLVLRDERQPREAGLPFRHRDPRKAFAAALQADVAGIRHPIVEVISGEISILDCDTHDWDSEPSDEVLEQLIMASPVTADFSWITHGRGLRFIFCGHDHRDAALATAISLPVDFKIELIQSTRHPAGSHPKYPGVAAGSVQANNIKRRPVDWSGVGRPDSNAVKAKLEELGLEVGKRHPHTACLIAPGGTSPDSVVVNDAGIYCFECAAKGKKYRSHLQPGFVPFSELVGRVSEFDRCARGLVHWAQARIQLAHFHPNLGEALVREIYEKTLVAIMGQKHPFVDGIFNRDLQLILSDSAWIDSQTLKPMTVTAKTLGALPACQSMITIKKRTRIIPRPPAVERAENLLPPKGYRPVTVVRGIQLRVAPGIIPLMARSTGPAVRLLNARELPPIEDLFASLENAFPGISREYILALLAGRICAEMAGQPCILLSNGPTGSGKGQCVGITASFFADTRAQLVLDTPEDEKFYRSLGTAIAGGQRFAFIDEVSRITKLGQRMRRLLELSDIVRWRPLYGIERDTPCWASITLASATLPNVLLASPEFCRRVRVVRLYRTVPDWQRTSGGNAADWRHRCVENAQIGNGLITHAYNLCSENNFHFSDVCDAIGLAKASELCEAADTETLRKIYEYCRAQGAAGKFSTSARFRVGGWIDANERKMQELLDLVVPESDETSCGQRFFHLSRNLEAIDWNGVLGFDSPLVVCEVRSHGAAWAMRFRSGEKALRGQHAVNEQLPPAKTALCHVATPLCQKSCHNGDEYKSRDSKEIQEAASRSDSYDRLSTKGQNVEQNVTDENTQRVLPEKTCHNCRNGRERGAI